MPIMALQLELKNYNFQKTHVCDPNADMYECWNVLSCRQKQEKIIGIRNHIEDASKQTKCKKININTSKF